MAEPTNLEEFHRLFNEGTRVEGTGLDVMMVTPCPFCAAPDFMRYRILETEAALAKGAMCAACGRSMRAVFERVRGSVRFEVVQTGGPDQPAWLDPKMRRF